MFGWLRKPPKADDSPTAQLLRAFQEIGLYANLTPRSFAELLDGDVAFAEILAEGNASQYDRHYLLAGLHGVISDWRFDPEDVLNQAASRLSEGSVLLRWDNTEGGRVRLSLGQHSLRWRYSNVAGLLEGVNRLLRQAGANWSFVGLYSGGDDYLFALLPDEQADKLRASSLFQEYKEADESAAEVS